MASLLVDTGFLVALYRRNHELHEAKRQKVPEPLRVQLRLARGLFTTYVRPSALLCINIVLACKGTATALRLGFESRSIVGQHGPKASEVKEGRGLDRTLGTL